MYVVGYNEFQGAQNYQDVQGKIVKSKAREFTKPFDVSAKLGASLKLLYIDLNQLSYFKRADDS